MPRIRQLPPEVANRIAAGEVVERPASVVKELCENALDAGATKIDVELVDAGRALIRITDNGGGIAPDELPLAFAAHATSKLNGSDDLFYIDTMGFRGEALASIGSVSNARIVSRLPDAGQAFEIRNDGGDVGEVRPASGAPGTTVEIANLFFNTPVRRKFLRQNSTEVSRAVDAIEALALAWPQVGFTLTSDGREALRLPPNQSRRDRVLEFAGKDAARDLIEINECDEYASVTGFIGGPQLHRPNSKQLCLFVNRRYIRDRSLMQAVLLAYREFIPHGRYPVAWLFIELDPAEVDVNVHPTKIEVRFLQANRLFGQIKGAVQEAVLRSGQLPRISLDDRRIEALKHIGSTDQRGRIHEAMAEFLARESSRGPGSAGRPSDELPRVAASYPVTEARPHGDAEPDLALAGPGYDTPDGNTAVAIAPALLTVESMQSARGYKSKDLPAALTTSQAVAPAAFGTGTAAQPAPAPTGNLLADARGFFQIANSYIIVETADGMVLIDQHAYHERVLFWQLEHRLETTAPELQRLLVPEPLELSPAARSMVADHRELFRGFGFEIEPFGAGGWACYALPRTIRAPRVGEFVASTLEELAASGRPRDPAELRKAMVEMTACRAAVKAGDALSGAEIEALLAEGGKVPHTFSCPHGRPTTFRLTLTDMEKLFHRR